MELLTSKLYQEQLDQNITLIKSICRLNDIRIGAWSDWGQGLAMVEDRVIHIPLPYNTIELGVCFHEIGHVMLGHTGVYGIWLEEYEAECYALDELDFYNYPTDEYEESARWHFMYRLSRAVNRGLNLSKVPDEVFDFIQQPRDKWTDTYVHVNYEEKTLAFTSKF